MAGGWIGVWEVIFLETFLSCEQARWLVANQRLQAPFPRVPACG